MSASNAKPGQAAKTPTGRIMSQFRDAKERVREQAASRQESASNRNSAAAEGRWPLPGLAPMTRVETSFGSVHAVALRKGDAVKTKSGAYREIVWLNRILLDQTLLHEKPDANPVRIRAGAIGHAQPTQDLLVSPRQQVAVSERVKAEAADLEGRKGFERQPETGLSYTMFHLGEPAEVECEGVYMLFEPPSAARRD